MSMCRICLSSGFLKDIFDAHIFGKENEVDIFNFCLGIKLTELTTTITKLCTKCVKKLKAFYKFKTLALNNNAYLQMLQLQAVVKLEDIAYNADYIKSEEVSLSENGIKEDCDSLDIKYEFPVDTELSTNLDIAFTADVKTAETAVGERFEDELPRHIKNELNKVIVNQKGKAERKPNHGKRKRTKYPVKKKMCPECGKEVNDLKQHSVVHLPKESRPQFPCDHCDKVLRSLRSKERHIQVRHLGIKSVCKICNKAVSQIKSHMQLIHNRESLSHVCKICGRAFAIPSNLAAHMVTHSTERPFQCDHCSATFASKQRLTVHMRAVHLKERTLLCQFCSKSFFRMCKLQQHLRCHTNERPYECPDCGKCFKTTEHLKRHLLIHGDEKKHACSECTMTFIKKDYLKVHMISHTKEKRHPCQYCGVKFGRSDHRKRHEFTAHQQHHVPNT